MTCPELARDAAEMLIVGPNAKGQSPGTPDRGAPEPSKGALNAKTPPSAPASQYPGTALVWGAGLAIAVDAVPRKEAASDTNPTANTFAIAIDRHLPAPCLDANAGRCLDEVARASRLSVARLIEVEPAGEAVQNIAQRASFAGTRGG